MVNEEHLQDLRERAAIAAMQGFITTMQSLETLNAYNRTAFSKGQETREFVAEAAVTYADALVAELYAKQNENQQPQ